MFRGCLKLKQLDKLLKRPYMLQDESPKPRQTSCAGARLPRDAPGDPSILHTPPGSSLLTGGLYATDGTGIRFSLPPNPGQEARLWGRERERDPRCRPSPPRGAVRSPSPSKRGWRLAPPTTVGKKNQFRGRQPRNEEEAKETCGVCLEPKWNNNMMFQPACNPCALYEWCV